MTNRQSHAIILKVTSHGESDKIVTLYSPDLGKITAIAKGAKRSKKRFVNKLEPFTLLHIFYRTPQRGSLFFLSEAELINAYLSLRTSYPRYITAMFINELVQRFCGEHDPDPAVFTLLNWAFDSLKNANPPDKTATLFLLRLLGFCGYQPQLDGCSSCHRPLEQTKSKNFTLYPGNGSLVCARCHKIQPDSTLTLSLQTLKFLHSAQQMQLRQLNRLQLPITTTNESLHALHNYSRHLLQQDIHSWNQLKSHVLGHVRK
jgi:DNA repair protein RecO (recombination protein O)